MRAIAIWCGSAADVTRHANALGIARRLVSVAPDPEITVRLGSEYAWCVRDKMDHRYDVQQGLCHADDLPVQVRKAADARYGEIPSYVEWPR